MLNRSDILNSIPQGEPFVFIDRAEVFENSVKGSYTITGNECFMAGHFPGCPIFPASIMVEALGQLAIAYLAITFGKNNLDPESIFFIKSEDVRCRRKCFPGEELNLSIEVKAIREPVATFKGQISVGEQIAVTISSMTLSFALVKN